AQYPRGRSYLSIALSYKNQSNIVVFSRKSGTIQMVGVGFAAMGVRFGSMQNVITFPVTFSRIWRTLTITARIAKRDLILTYQLLKNHSQTLHTSDENKGLYVLPDRLAVVCSSIEGIYFPSLHVVVCKCCSCGKPKQRSLREWERHTGSKNKNCKSTIIVKGSTIPLEHWILQVSEYLEHGLVSTNTLKTPSLEPKQQKLIEFLQEKYEPVVAKWTTERCAVCRWVEDWEDNKIIICIRCQIAVHQECYGAKHVRDFTSWVCRACETPDVQRECCLCPVKGGALKPCEVKPLWVHVTCAWFQPEVSFSSDETMEPAVGIFSIPSSSFVKVCVICNQAHGSCQQCFKCLTCYHAMCAS
ncbi:hypothetical protein MKX01_022893, partial [Papaver californicum]